MEVITLGADQVWAGLKHVYPVEILRHTRGRTRELPKWRFTNELRPVSIFSLAKTKFSLPAIRNNGQEVALVMQATHAQPVSREFSIVRERRHVTPCLSSAPSSTGYCERRHRSVDNVKSVGLEFKICTLTSE